MSASTPTQGKPERHAKQPVDLGDADDIPAPVESSQKGGPGSGREQARRVTQRIPRAGGAEAHEKPHQTGMMDKGVSKQLSKEAKRRTSGNAPPSAAPAEAAPTQRQTLKDDRPRRRTARDQGLDEAQ